MPDGNPTESIHAALNEVLNKIYQWFNYINDKLSNFIHLSTNSFITTEKKLESISTKLDSLSDKNSENFDLTTAFSSFESRISNNLQVVCNDINTLKAFSETVADEHAAHREKEVKESYLFPSIRKFISLYVAYYNSLELIEDIQAKLILSKLFEEIEQYLTENGIDKLKSSPNETFMPSRRYRQTYEATANKNLDGLIKESLGFGFCSETAVYQPERVVVWRHDPTLKADVEEDCTHPAQTLESNSL
jgi:hypothetical protein